MCGHACLCVSQCNEHICERECPDTINGTKHVCGCRVGCSIWAVSVGTRVVCANGGVGLCEGDRTGRRVRESHKVDEEVHPAHNRREVARLCESCVGSIRCACEWVGSSIQTKYVGQGYARKGREEQGREQKNKQTWTSICRIHSLLPSWAYRLPERNPPTTTISRTDANGQKRGTGRQNRRQRDRNGEGET